MNRPKAGSWLSRAALLFFSSLLAIALLPAAAAADDDDPPGRVARMNYAQGSVSFQPGGEGDWVDAVPNRPMTTGDNLWVDRDSRAELHLGSTAIHLSSETSLTFLTLDDRTTQLRLAQGSIILHVRHVDDEDYFEIDTPNLAFQIQRTGDYRIDTRDDGRTTVIDVFRGRGQVTGGGDTYAVVGNQEATFRGGDQQNDERLNYDIETLPQEDQFDSWAFDRDRREDRSESSNYVSREMTGYEDLDDNGRWSYDAQYGHVWIPTRVADGWAPYRDGHWAWVAPWGWTWVDDEPWGFAPFHYGRWCRVREGWGWIPGPVVARPVYAPALVAFVGGGGFHLSVGFGGGGGVAWFPLGPGDVFVPAYHVSRNYVNQVNVTNTNVNVTKITNVYNTTVINKTVVNNNTTVINNNVTKIVYVNQTAPNAVTAVSRETFVNAKPVAHNTVQVSQHEIEQAPVTHTTEMAPVHTSVMGSGKPTQAAPPAAVANRQVVAQRAPTPTPVPFAQRRDPLVAQPARPAQPVAQPTQPVNVHQMPPQTAPVHAGPNDVPRPNQPIIDHSRPVPPQAQDQPQAQPQHQPIIDHSRPVPPQAQDRPEAQPQVQPQTQPQRPPAPKPQQEVPRPPAPQQHPQVAPPEPARAPQPANEARPQQPEWSHPLAKPAAPPRPPSPEQGQAAEQKFHDWQEKQRTAPPPRPPAAAPQHAPAPPPSHPPAKEEARPEPKQPEKHN